MKTRAWQCVAGAALVVGTLSAAEAARQPDPPPMVERSSTTTIDPGGPGSGGPDPAQPGGEVLYAIAASGLLSFGGIVLVGGVIGLGGLRVPGGVSMTVARSRLWYRSVRRIGGHRAP
ncbi:hypothetical protein AB0M46_37085 [Dactylosporangium sp. NPDC051485]|uniref:hypothetical protein n=1 Tax=Dactylosporangium sp. NPDC051485 TaxID=3154846 RepID=UPI003443D0FE